MKLEPYNSVLWLFILAYLLTGEPDDNAGSSVINAVDRLPRVGDFTFPRRRSFPLR